MIPIKHNIQYKEKLTNDINMSSKSKDLKRIDRVHQLDLFELTGSGVRDVLIKEVKAYYENGDIKYEKYYIYGQKHRDNGPALLTCNDDNTINEYYLLT